MILAYVVQYSSQLTVMLCYGMISTDMTSFAAFYILPVVLSVYDSNFSTNSILLTEQLK